MLAVRCYVLLFTLLITLYGPAQTVHLPAALRLGAYAAQGQHPLAAFANQAALSNVPNFSAAVYSEKRFLLQELTTCQLAAVLPTTSGHFGVQMAYFGGGGLQHTTAGLAYSKALGSKVAVGAQFNYLNYSITGYGHNSAVNFEAGLLLRLSDQLHAGVHAYNPTGASFFTNNEEKLPAVYSAGFGYEASGQLFINAEIIKTENQPVDLQTGLIYRFNQKLLAKAGMATAATEFYFGAGVQLKDFGLEAIASVHPHLGLTPGLLLIYKKDK